MRYQRNKNTSSGFTLIELLVVIVIMGILFSFIGINILSPLAKTRDTERRNNLRQLQAALEQYYNDFGSYPSTTGLGCFSNWCGETATYGSHTTDYIPNASGCNQSINCFVPKYFRKLPNEPNAGKSNTNCGGEHVTYLYNSNGSNYKLMSHCSPENQSAMNNPKDSFYDPVRPTHTWQVSSDGAYNW